MITREELERATDRAVVEIVFSIPGVVSGLTGTGNIFVMPDKIVVSDLHVKSAVRFGAASAILIQLLCEGRVNDEDELDLSIGNDLAECVNRVADVLMWEFSKLTSFEGLK